MNSDSQLPEQLRALGLHGMVEGLEHQWNSSTYAELSFEHRFGHLVANEAGFRDRRRLARLLKDGKLKILAQPEDIDYRPGRGLDRAYMADLLTCRWAEHKRNILVTGPRAQSVGRSGEPVARREGLSVREGHAAAG